VALPVLVVCFDRSRQLANLLGSLANHPGPIYVAQDVPASGSAAKEGGYRATRDVILRAIDSGQDLSVVPRPDRHLGLKGSWEVAIGHVLEIEEDVIVLEDDVLPHPHFFRFVGQARERYAANPAVGHISGFNYVPRGALSRPESAARLSAIPHTLGMLLRREWIGAYRSDLSDWRDWLEPEHVLDIVGSRVVARNWMRAFDRVTTGKADSWAITWSASMWAAQRWALTSNQNHVRYDGYDGGTHSNPTWAELAAGELADSWVIEERDLKADSWEFAHGFQYDGVGTLKRYSGIAIRRAGDTASSLWSSKFLKS
jgi:hypothetical protein